MKPQQKPIVIVKRSPKHPPLAAAKPEEPKRKRRSNKISEAKKKRKRAKVRRKKLQLIAQQRKEFLADPPKELVEWVDANWEKGINHESGLFPATFLFPIAKEQGMVEERLPIEWLCYEKLKPLGIEVIKQHRREAALTLNIWFQGGQKNVFARDIAKEVGLTPLQVHGVLCLAGYAKRLPRWVERELSGEAGDVSSHHTAKPS